MFISLKALTNLASTMVSFGATEGHVNTHTQTWTITDFPPLA